MVSYPNLYTVDYSVCIILCHLIYVKEKKLVPIQQCSGLTPYCVGYHLARVLEIEPWLACERWAPCTALFFCLAPSIWGIDIYIYLNSLPPKCPGLSINIWLVFFNYSYFLPWLSSCGLVIENSFLYSLMCSRLGILQIASL